MNNGSENYIEIIVECNKLRYLKEEINSGLEVMLSLFNDRVLEIINGIEPDMKDKSTFLNSLRNTFHKITGKTKSKEPESISEIVEKNCLKLIAICENRDIALFPVFGNLILDGVNITCGIRIGTVSLRKNDGIKIDSFDDIYSNAKEYFPEDMHQNG